VQLERTLEVGMTTVLGPDLDLDQLGPAMGACLKLANMSIAEAARRTERSYWHLYKVCRGTVAATLDDVQALAAICPAIKQAAAPLLAQLPAKPKRKAGAR
jgi:hypothetical protein